jgi:2,4-dienoyl-CoA reductase-like NADH-dependent reductase (Old Yellow Enzyme family)
VTRLSDPLTLRGMTLRNRLVMAPMVTGMAVDHAPSEAQLAWYRQHARAGVGLVIVESAAIAPDGKLLPFMLGVWDDAQIPGLARLTAAIQEEGVPAVLQIVHGGAKAWRADILGERMGPSPVPIAAGPAPREMTEADIAEVIQAFAQAARRAQAAGFAGVELHGAHYYLISQFLSPCTNQRTDRWGGDRDGRARLGLEVVRAVRQAVGPDFPLFMRMHAVEFFDGGMSEADAVHFARAFQEAGIDLIDASGIGTSSIGEWKGQAFLNTSSVLPKERPGGAFLPFTARLKAALDIPVIAVGKLGEPGLAQAALEADQVDLVALARQLIADPLSATKLLEGREGDIDRCQECLACFVSIRKGPLRCGVNKSL